MDHHRTITRVGGKHLFNEGQEGLHLLRHTAGIGPASVVELSHPLLVSSGHLPDANSTNGIAVHDPLILKEHLKTPMFFCLLISRWPVLEALDLGVNVEGW